MRICSSAKSSPKLLTFMALISLVRPRRRHSAGRGVVCLNPRQTTLWSKDRSASNPAKPDHTRVKVSGGCPPPANNAPRASEFHPTDDSRQRPDAVTAASMESIGRIDRGNSRLGTPAAQSSGRQDRGRSHPGTPAAQPPGAAAAPADRSRMPRCARSSRRGRGGN